MQQLRLLHVALAVVFLTSIVCGQVGGQAGCPSAFAITTPLTSTPLSVISSNTKAQVQASNPCYTFPESSSGSVWYTVAPEPGAVVTLTTCQPNTNFDTQISVYTGSCNNLLCLTASDYSNCPANGNQAAVQFLAQEAIYYIAVGGPNGAQGTIPFSLLFYSKYLPLASGQFQMAVSATNALPVGCFEAINVSGPLLNDPVYILSSNDNAPGLPASVPACGAISAASHITWYTVSLTPGLATIVTTCNVGTTVDTIVSVYAGDDCLTLECMAFNDDSTCGNAFTDSTVTFTPNSTAPYHIAVSGYGTNSGTFELSIVQEGFYQACRSATPFNVGPSTSIAGVTSPTGTVLQEEPCNFGYTGAPAEFFQLNFNSYSTVTLSTCNIGTYFDTKLMVYSGSCDDLACIAYSDDDYNCNADERVLTSTVTFTPVAGTNYFAVVTGAYFGPLGLYPDQFYGNFVLVASQ